MAQGVIDITGMSERDAAAVVFESGAVVLAKYLAQLDPPTATKSLADWLDSIEARVLTAVERESPGSSARYYAQKAGRRITVAEAVRDEKGRLMRTLTREVSEREAASLETVGAVL